MLSIIDINLKTDVKPDKPVHIDAMLMSQDKHNNQFMLRFTNGGEAVTLDDTYTVEILSKFTKAGTSLLTSATVHEDYYATWEFDTDYITQEDEVRNYVYVRKSDDLVVSADANCFVFNVGLSEIDKGAGKVAETYDENYQKYLDEFKENVNFEEIAQAEQARKEAEILREESYEQKVDLAIVEADVMDKVDDKVTELTPQINNLTAQLAQKANDNIVVKKGHGTLSDFDESTRQAIQGMNPTDVNAVLGDRNVQPINTTFMRNGINLLDKKRIEKGKFVNGTGGQLVSHPTYCATHFIPVEPNTTYYGRWAVANYFASYDSSKLLTTASTSVQSGTYSEDLIITTSTTCKYLKVTVYNESRLDEAYLIKGDSPLLNYVPYEEFLTEDYLPPIPLNKMPPEITNKRTSIEDLTFAKTTNLFNINSSETLIDKYIVNTGSISDNVTYVVTNFIRVSAGDKINISGLGARFTCFFNENKQVVSGGSSVELKSFTIPNGVSYIRCTIYKSNINGMMINKGDTLLSYSEYGYKIPSKYIEIKNDEEFLLFIPSEICVAVGRTIELYNNQVSWCGNIDNYHFQWNCQVGKPMKRKLSIVGEQSKIGNYPLTLNVYDNNMNIVASAASAVKIVDNALATTKNYLCIGDSLTNMKHWMVELDNLTSNKIKFVGTRRWLTYYHEGRSGFTADNYLKETSYAFEGEGVHPFWNPTLKRFDYNYYKAQTGVNPDAIQIYLGINGIKLDPTENANNIKQIVDFIRQDDVNIPIYLVMTPFRANQNGIGVQTSNDGYVTNSGVWKLEDDRKVFNLITNLYELMKNYTNLHFVPIALCHDSEHNYGAVSTPVNPRASQTELLPIEATHPQQQGYNQMADVMYSVWCAYND